MNLNAALSGDRHHIKHFNVLADQVPDQHAESFERRYIQLIEKTTERSNVFQANKWAREFLEGLTHNARDLADDSVALDDAAEAYSHKCHQISEPADKDDLTDCHRHLQKCIAFARRRGIAPTFSRKMTIRGMMLRMAEKHWWRRQLKKAHWECAEDTARNLGMVSFEAGRYASYGATARRQKQNLENQQKLASTNMVAPDGSEKSLLEVSQHNTTDKTCRRHETLARLKGMDLYQRQLGMVAEFWTVTAPSQYHATNYDGTANRHYKQHSPKETNDYLISVWQKVRIYFERKGIECCGMRCAEPHHDGTPHHHFIIYLWPDQAEQAWAIFCKFAEQLDSEELHTAKRLEARRKRVIIDERGVIGYVLKYICKNLDGSTDTDKPSEDAKEMSGVEAAKRVDAWSSHHRIRQFHFFGQQTKIEVWRKLRSMEELPENASKQMTEAHRCARAGDFGEYLDHSDGLAVIAMPVIENEETGECKVSYYDERPIMQAAYIQDANGMCMALPVGAWEIKINQALRTAFHKMGDKIAGLVKPMDHPFDMLIPF